MTIPRFKDVIAYIQGNLRYSLYYSKFKFLIRKHIREQIEFRIKVMNKFCYNQGSCVRCGCVTTALQMADKSCNKPCYPPMLSKHDWYIFKDEGFVYKGNDMWSMCLGTRKNPNQITIFRNESIVNTAQK